MNKDTFQTIHYKGHYIQSCHNREAKRFEYTISGQPGLYTSLATVKQAIRNKTNKYIQLWVLQGNYGHGWEDLCAAETWREIKENRKEYRENEPGTPLRTIKRRELNSNTAI